MISNNAGTILIKNTKIKPIWIKLGLALILSNIFFFILFSDDSSTPSAPPVPQGWVEIQLHAELFTSYEDHKKILLVHRPAKKKFPAILKKEPVDPTGRYTVLVQEKAASEIFEHTTWEILPDLKTLSFIKTQQRENHEIRY